VEVRRALLSAIVVVVLDQVTKIWAVSRLTNEPGQRIDLGWGAELQLHFNTGAAFSRGTNFGQVIAVVAIGMSVLLIRLASQRSDRFGQIVLGGLAGGAVGNLLDRIFRAEEGPLSGAVVDFLRPVDFFAIFNVADAAIVIGVIAVLAQGLLFPPDDESVDSGSKNTAESKGSETGSPVGEGIGNDLEDVNIVEDADTSDESLPSV